MSSKPSPTATAAIGDGFRSLFRPPFRALVLISILIAITLTTFSATPSETETMFSVLLIVASLYIQIAVILAAGRDEPEPSADAWLRGAFRRRCFWRYLGTSLLVVLGLFAGALLLVVGIFFVGALIGLAQSASVLERRLPMDAIARSARVAKESRRTVGIVFTVLVLIPNVAIQTMGFMGWADDLGAALPIALGVGDAISAAGVIALTRLFVALGGERTPPPGQLAPTRPPA